ncbi:MAG TPA: ATP-binding protein [Polyangiaceae bacterium]|nr:ATP-binding protein [Polyangiaceae bacterium]
MQDELARENQVLRDRIIQLEQALDSGSDPLRRYLSEHASEFLTVIDLEGHMLATGRTSEAFGSVIGRSIFDFVEPASAEVMRATFARVAQTRRPERYECVGQGEDGSSGHTYLTRAIPLVEHEEVRAILIVPTDITDRVRLERSLIEKGEALSLAIGASRMGLWSWDIPTNQIEWNDRLCEIWGVAQTPPDFQSYIALVHPDDRALVQEMVSEALATGIYRAFEHRVITLPERRQVWLLAVGTVIKDAEDKPMRLMGGGIDITEQKRLAMQNQRAARVESLGQLAAGIAHNFNNLLAVIVPNIELEIDGSVTENPGLSAALEASLQARDLVRNLLLLTQRGASRSSTTADPLDVVARVIGICRVTFPREICLEHHVEGPVGHVSMQATDLEQVLLNLLFNARDALDASLGPLRQASIDLRRVLDDSGSPAIELRVSDTGVGMHEDVQTRVFEPFFSTKPPHKGSGLGLANVAERVRDAGGSIRCESALGEGTTFTLLLPERSVPASAPASPPVPIAPCVTGTVVLLVDDEAPVRRTIRRLLERDGYTILEAGHAQEARELLAHTPVALVILDQSMPNETGIHAFPSLRKLTDAPVVLYSGMLPVAPPGIAAVLEKPARPDDLRRLVKSVLAKRERQPLASQ